MADVIRISTPNSLNALHPVFVQSPNFSFHKRAAAAAAAAAATSSSVALVSVAPPFSTLPRKQKAFLKVNAVVAEASDPPKWWEKTAGPNMIDIHSTEEFLKALSEAGDRLVIVEFYGTWCASCRALFPKFCRTAEEHPEIVFIKVNFDENKPMSKSMNVKVLPYFQFYRGADGKLEEFSCSLTKFQKIKDAIEKHNPVAGGSSTPEVVSEVIPDSSSSSVETSPEPTGT